MIFRRKNGGGVASRLNYQGQNSAQTLAEGLEEYYRANIGRVTRPDELPPKSAGLFRGHDACHVIFGLNTTPDDEALADTRTLVSCDVGARRYLAYLARDQQARTLFKEFGYLRSLWVTLLATPRICRAVGEARRMTKRWPWAPPDIFMRRPLADLRREFGIRII
jgi:hypothetical protein